MILSSGFAVFLGGCAVFHSRYVTFCGRYAFFGFFLKLKPFPSGHMVHTFYVIGRIAAKTAYPPQKVVYVLLKTADPPKKNPANPLKQS